MATRLKTVHYAFPTLASLPDNTLTSLTQRTIFLPETGTKTFRSVIAHVTFIDGAATAANITTKTLNLRLGAAAFTSIANANALTNSGEAVYAHLVADYTSHFTTNWTGTSMTCDFQIQLSRGTATPAVSVTLEITYEYDDTSTTQVKSVMIPLNAAVGAIATVATTVDTFPALDTYLPETSKTYRDMFVVVQGNTHTNASTTDATMTVSVGGTTVTTPLFESALASDNWFRYVFDILAAGFAGQAATQNFQLSATVARFNHLQAYAVITYEYNESTSTSIMNSVYLPMECDSPMGGVTSADYQRATRDLYIEEPATITTNKIAFYPFWNQIAAIGGLNMRVGTGAFVAYTDAASTLCGTNGAMVRNDAAFSLVRGKNTINFDVYRTDTADFGWNISGFWLINYTSGKATSGSGSHNHSIFYGLAANGTAAAATTVTTGALAPSIPEADYFINALGTHLITLSSGTTAVGGFTIQVERLVAEGGNQWERVYNESCQSDPEMGIFHCVSQMRTLFKRWPGDNATDRMDIETARRWRITLGGPANPIGWFGLNLVFTYHSILSAVSGTITDSAGGTVNITLHDGTTGETLKTASRTGNGVYSITFFGDTRTVYTTARESATLLGRSDNGTPTLV